MIATLGGRLILIFMTSTPSPPDPVALMDQHLHECPGGLCSPPLHTVELPEGVTILLGSLTLRQAPGGEGAVAVFLVTGACGKCRGLR